MQMLSRQKPATGPGSSTPAQESKKKKQLPKLEEYLDARDYTGAITLLEVSQKKLFNLVHGVIELLEQKILLNSFLLSINERDTNHKLLM